MRKPKPPGLWVRTAGKPGFLRYFFFSSSVVPVHSPSSERIHGGGRVGQWLPDRLVTGESDLPVSRLYSFDQKLDLSLQWPGAGSGFQASGGGFGATQTTSAHASIYCHVELPPRPLSMPCFAESFVFLILLRCWWFTMLISVVQQSDSVIHTHIFSLLYSFPLWFIKGHWI